MNACSFWLREWCLWENPLDGECFVDLLVLDLHDFQPGIVVDEDPGLAVVADDGVSDVQMRPGLEFADCPAKPFANEHVFGYRTAVAVFEYVAHPKAVAFGHATEMEVDRTGFLGRQPPSFGYQRCAGSMGADDIGAYYGIVGNACFFHSFG